LKEEEALRLVNSFNFSADKALKLNELTSLNASSSFN